MARAAVFHQRNSKSRGGIVKLREPLRLTPVMRLTIALLLCLGCWSAA